MRPTALLVAVALAMLAFDPIALVAPLANVLVAPVIAPATILGFVGVGVSFFSSTAAYWIGMIVDTLVRYALFVVRFCADIPFASVSVDFGFLTAWFVSLGIFALGLLIVRGIVDNENPSREG